MLYDLLTITMKLITIQIHLFLLNMINHSAGNIILLYSVVLVIYFEYVIETLMEQKIIHFYNANQGYGECDNVVVHKVSIQLKNLPTF